MNDGAKYIYSKESLHNFQPSLSGNKLDNQALISDFVFVPEGFFIMGNLHGKEDSSFPHIVKVNSFYICRYQLTQAVWNKYRKNNPARFTGNDLPVDSVSWYDAVGFAMKLVWKKVYRLATVFPLKTVSNAIGQLTDTVFPPKQNGNMQPHQSIFKVLRKLQSFSTKFSLEERKPQTT